MPYRINTFTGEFDRTQKSTDNAITIETDNGSATPDSEVLRIIGGANTTTAGSGNTVAVISTATGGGSTEFSDDEFSVFNTTDTTKKRKYDISAIDTNTTRTLKAANYDIDEQSLTSTFNTDSGFAITTQGAVNIVGGTNINTSSSGNTVTINSTGGAGDYVNVATNSVFIPAANDEFLSCDTTNFFIRIQLPTTENFRKFIIKDRTGNATIRNIIVNTLAALIDGKTTFILSANHECEQFIFNGTDYEVY